MSSLLRTFEASILVALFAAGCGRSEQAAETSPDVPADASYLLTAEPQGAAGVAEARQADAEEVTVIGRVGGSPHPFVEGMAAFTIVDPKIPHCAAEEGCPTPWDYCCTKNQLADNMALVKVIDSQGRPVASDARELLGIRGLSVVVVKGESQRDGEGNLTVLAEQIYVKSS